MKRCPKPIAWTPPTGLHLLHKEPNQPMGSRKNILVVQALQVVQVALAMCRWTWEISCLLALRDACVARTALAIATINNEMQARLNVLHAVNFGI